MALKLCLPGLAMVANGLAWARQYTKVPPASVKGRPSATGLIIHEGDRVLT
jgi:hypothetical protein